MGVLGTQSLWIMLSHISLAISCILKGLILPSCYIGHRGASFCTSRPENRHNADPYTQVVQGLPRASAAVPVCPCQRGRYRQDHDAKQILHPLQEWYHGCSPQSCPGYLLPILRHNAHWSSQWHSASATWRTGWMSQSSLKSLKDRVPIYLPESTADPGDQSNPFSKVRRSSDKQQEADHSYCNLCKAPCGCPQCSSLQAPCDQRGSPEPPSPWNHCPP